MEERLAFCPSCGAPQIRVASAPEPEPASLTLENAASSPPGQIAAAPVSQSDLARAMGATDWKRFLRTAVPVAILVGMLTIAVRPLGLFLLLPLGVIWTIARYRQQRPTPLRGGQGARMGALMAVLSFASFLLPFLVDFSLSPAKYREQMISSVHEVAAQNPDPQVQQVLQWFATPDGLIIFTSIALIIILLVFLIIGMGSGALAVVVLKPRNQS